MKNQLTNAPLEDEWFRHLGHLADAAFVDGGDSKQVLAVLSQTSDGEAGVKKPIEIQLSIIRPSECC